LVEPIAQSLIAEMLREDLGKRMTDPTGLGLSHGLLEFCIIANVRLKGVVKVTAVPSEPR